MEPQSLQAASSNLQQSTGSPLSSGSYTDVQFANPDLNGQICPGADSRNPASHSIARPQSLQAIGSNVEQPTCLPFLSGFPTNISANLEPKYKWPGTGTCMVISKS